MRLHLDLETRCELDLVKVGARNYTRHPSFEILSAAVAFGRDSVYVYERLPDLPWLDYPIHAFNAPFERECLAGVGIKIPASQFRCTMYHAYCRGFSGGLAAVGAQVGIPQDKAKIAAGGRLIAKFCKPRRPSRANPDLWWTKETAPEDWAQFLEYNRRDVEAEREIARVLDEWPLTEEEHNHWFWDQAVNDRGLPVDYRLAQKAAWECERWRVRYLDELATITGLENPNSRDQMLAWARGQGYTGPDLRADTIREILK